MAWLTDEMSKGHAVIDGSNLATEGRKEPSLAQLDEAVRAIDAEYDFANITVIVDATFEHRVAKSETKAARAAIDDGDIITPPAGVIGRGDAFILQVADRAGAVVFSNDSFQEFHGTYDWLFDEGRLIGGKPVPGVGWIYVTRSPVRGPVSRRATSDSRKAAAKKTSTRATRTTRTTPAKKAEADKPAAKTAREPAARRERKPRAAAATSGDGSNDQSRWKNFKDDYPVGTTIAATVDRFSSHGAYGSVDGIVVYLPNRLLGDPPPTKARDVLDLGATIDFVVHRYDSDRHGIDAGLIPAPGVTPSSARTRPARGSSAKKATPKKTTPKKTAAKKPAARKATKKAAAKPTTKKAVKKTAATSTAKKTAARKPATKKTTAKKATTKKTTAKKTTTKKTTAKKATAKKASRRR
jgi:Zc3h12a-like Ribonuclease NYN domain